MIFLTLYNSTILAILLISFLNAYLYIYFWRKYVSNNKVPQGYGLLVIYYLFIFSLILKLDINFVYTFFLILILSSVYWIDDLKSLSAKLRFFLQGTSGFFIFIINAYSLSEYFLLILIFASFFGLLNILLTNITNFYDGLDLNLSIFVLINSMISMFIFNNNLPIILILTIIIIFTLTFSVFNMKKNNLFFGDSGCFVFSSILILLIIYAFNQNNLKIFYLFISISLPLIDVFYVLIYRIIKKESLLTRNHYHLYQKYEKFFKNKSYLLLQIINSFLIILILFILNSFYVLNVNLIMIVSIITSIIFYTLSNLFINEYKE